MVALVLGWIGSICFALAGMPQAWRCYCQGHSRGLSPLFLGLWFTGEVCYVAAVLLQFGWVGWMLTNYIVNILCILIMGFYYFKPRVS